MTNKLEIGKSATAETVVSEINSASAVGSGNLPVFATPMMVALMEQAACHALADCLDDGQTSVGTEIKIWHKAATVFGAKVTAVAEITAVNGCEVEFGISAHDEVGEIGLGTHKRFIVSVDKFMAKASKRVQRFMNFIHEENRVYCQDENGTVLAEVLFPAIDAETLDINRTFVADSLRGQGVADKLMKEAYKNIKAHNKKVVLSCSYAVMWFNKNIENRDILK